MDWWKKGGSTMSWVMGGATIGMVVATVFAVVWTAWALIAYGRSPGNDPLFPMMIVWMFFLMPAGVSLGAIAGGALRIGVLVVDCIRHPRDYRGGRG